MAGLETLLVALAFAAVYAGAGRLSHIRLSFPQRWLSFAAGVSVAYVFVDILPELEARRQSLVKAPGGNLFYAEQRIYIVVLLGFVFFYGLENFLLRSRASGKPRDGGGTEDAAF